MKASWRQKAETLRGVLAAHRLALLSCGALLALFAAFVFLMVLSPAAVPDNPLVEPAVASRVVWTGEGYTAPTQDAGKENESNGIASQQPETEVLPDEEDISRGQTSSESTQTGGTGKSSGEKTGGKSKDTVPGGSEPTSSDTGEPSTTRYEDSDPEEQVHGPAEEEDDDENQEGAREVDPDEDPEDEGMRPTIWTDLEDNATVDASSLTFNVQVTDCNGMSIGTQKVRPDRGRFTIEATPKGGSAERLTSVSDSGWKDGQPIVFRLYLEEESYEVVITATDREDRTATARYTVNRGDPEELVRDATVTFTLEASTVGLGKLIGPVEVEFAEGETLAAVLERVVTAEGFTVRGRRDRHGELTYLQSLRRTNITDGAEIPADLLAKLESVGYTPADHQEDSLGDYDFSGNSGWMFSVNDTYMDIGLNSTFLADGDEVRVRFTLFAGADIGGADTYGAGKNFEKEW